MPLTPAPAPGVAAGVAGVVSFPLAGAAVLDPVTLLDEEFMVPEIVADPFPVTAPVPVPGPCCVPAWPLCIPLASLSEDGGVISPAPPGNDSEAGEVKALACCAVEGCVVSDSMMAAVFRA